jgi:hypothetical protein
MVLFYLLHKRLSNSELPYCLWFYSNCMRHIEYCWIFAMLCDVLFFSNMYIFYFKSHGLHILSLFYRMFFKDLVMWRHYNVILENSDITTRPWQCLAISDNLNRLSANVTWNMLVLNIKGRINKLAIYIIIIHVSKVENCLFCFLILSISEIVIFQVLV